jgi:hypothetical protein
MAKSNRKLARRRKPSPRKASIKTSRYRRRNPAKASCTVADFADLAEAEFVCLPVGEKVSGAASDVFARLGIFELTRHGDTRVQGVHLKRSRWNTEADKFEKLDGQRDKGRAIAGGCTWGPRRSSTLWFWFVRLDTLLTCSSLREFSASRWSTCSLPCWPQWNAKRQRLGELSPRPKSNSTSIRKSRAKETT